MRRLRSLTRRQVVSASGAGVLCVAVAAAALTGNVGLALTLLAVFFTILFAGLLLLARRLSGLQRIQRRQQTDARTVLDQTQRRLLAALEELVLHAGDRHGEVADRMGAQTRQVEAIVQLFQQVTPRAPMPPSGGAADLLDVLHLIRTRRPRVVLELGGGASTVWMAYAIEEFGGRLVSLDPDARRVERTRATLAAHHLSETAEVREGPVSPEGLADVHDVGLLVVGSPVAKADMPLLTGRLGAVAKVFLRDAPDSAARWLETTEGLTPEGEALLSYRRVVRELSNRTPA
ncbi:class I SAM-dependent methyltransferase [Actinoplanes sp. TRM 88003]|uniref:Class I SAM-dependent methyltransferase n=1 Tax=Paractinoplanes aksuensis TaxID=2939490 RepID=A0ABT1DMA1_9ACTN|nr:class I SAM-dependent methyltransferase [Actinoplanes aksuensis]MCO8271940.1 class I SAM-dependent methyltransferase [Actinoplanes aksuensis]